MSLRARLETRHIISPAAGWTGTVTLVPAPPPPSRVRAAVYSALVSSTAATQFYFADTAGTPVSGAINLAADMPLMLEQNNNTDPWFLTAATLGLTLVVVSGGPLTGDIYWLPQPE